MAEKENERERKNERPPPQRALARAQATLESAGVNPELLARPLPSVSHLGPVLGTRGAKATIVPLLALLQPRARKELLE